MTASPAATRASREDRGGRGCGARRDCDVKSPSMRLVPAILCGGAGSRLWPVSRELHPKPFIRLADGQSLLQKAFLRGARLPGVSEVLTVTNRELFSRRAMNIARSRRIF